MKATFVVNIVSLTHLGFQWQGFPGCCFALPQQLIEDALKIGYAGVQALPIRGLTGEEDRILLYEDAWNAVPSLLHGLRHKTGASGMPSCINDWVVSPHPEHCREVSERLEKRVIIKVSHQFDFCKRHLVEVHPGLDMTPEQIVARCEKTGQRLVLDNEHLFRPYTASEIAAKPERAGKASPLVIGTSLEVSDGINIDQYNGIVETLWPYVEAIHFHPEDERFPYHILSILRRKPKSKLIVVAEYPPILTSAKKSRDYAKAVLEKMRVMVEG